MDVQKHPYTLMRPDRQHVVPDMYLTKAAPPPDDGITTNGIKLSRAERRQVIKNAARVERISDSDRRYFRRFPDRRHRLRLAATAEVEQQVLVCGLVLRPDRALHVVVKSYPPSVRTKLFVQLPKGFDTDQPEAEVAEFWNAAAEHYPEIRKLESVLGVE